MRIGEGVEWGLHCCLTLAWLGEEPVSTAKFATLFELPPAYLKKRLQALVRAGILTSTPGAKGGFLLARPPERITLMDVVTALEGPDEAFRCTEIRQRGVEPSPEFARPCGVAAAMRKAELAWRRELAAQSVADLVAAAPPGAAARMRQRYARL
ncbi:RrF2 family transcriptional regulator [Nonomuraea pusilla]|uniref:Transcriptional regulator, BadM/Rrf2 family n=1 Tax=Nonomuraea pusilla TaxID=46177 RepID=A0A1H7YEH4_9ACTN|nr:Rrf2 family transcriptional regulator [Nonomuraea pusilla]SEM44274.1 transcriptional regulator, BadM/Rrf2 family [Nonomuraea pusilla]